MSFGKEVICSGEVLYDFISTLRGEGLGKSDTFVKHAGGSPFNIAVGLSRLGVNTALLTKVGSDEFGYELKDVMLQERLDPRFIIEAEDKNTTLAMTSIDVNGQAYFRFYRDNAADVSLTWNELPAIDARDVSIYHFGSISLLEPPSSETYARLFRTMKSQGVMTVLDPNIRPQFMDKKPDFRRRLRDWISEVDVLKMSDEDLMWISEGDNVEQRLARLELNSGGLVILTEGAKGARAFWRGEETRFPAFDVKVADTAGCGDSFMAGIMFRLSQLTVDGLASLDSFTLYGMLRFASACAAIVATRHGAAESMPRPGEVEEFLQSQE